MGGGSPGDFGWGGVMYYSGEINTGVPPDLGGTSHLGGVWRLYKSLICEGISI